DISRQDTWGIGEHTVSDSGKKLTSGVTLVERFKAKSRGSNDQTDNSVFAIMGQHKQAVQNLKDTYAAIRKQMRDQDADEAAKYAQLEKNLPQQPAVNVAPFYVPCYAG